jgi:tetratricopeptide (TPR) repeat protein
MRAGTYIADRFELEHVAGSGGMGTVYRARDRTTGEIVALKILHGEASRDVDRFVREARTLAELKHPRIVRYVAHGRTQTGELYLAMEWLGGKDLSAILAHRALSLEDCVTLTSQVAEGLAAAHQKGIIHRDIKPENLYLVEGKIDRVKILDFGLARMHNATRSPTRTGMILGTPGYMAPEQAQGSRELDARTDVFALGCVFFECLTGRPVFLGENVLGLLAKILLEEAQRVSDLRPDVPAGLDDLVHRMLCKDPAGRPRDGQAIVAELALQAEVLRAASRAAPRTVSREGTYALTEGEQRLLCVVLAGAALAVVDESVAKTLPAQAQGVPGPGDLPSSLRAAVQAFGGRFEHLADRSAVTTLVGSGAATDQALQAARCALAMRTLLPDAPMALATGRGEVQARFPLGEVIDRAARMLGRTPQGRAVVAPGKMRAIAIDEVTAGLLDSRFEVGGDARGLELLGERDVAEAGRTLLGKPSPCVGRERELGVLAGVFDECVGESAASAVLVTAAAGVGKSRLWHEFVSRLRQREEPLEIWTARGDPMRAGSPFGLLAPAIKGACGLFDGEPLPVRQKKLRARVGRHLKDDVQRVTEFLGELVGVPFPHDDRVQLRAARQDAMLMGDQMRRAWEDWLAAECSAQPVLLVLEDLHWGDLPTVKFVEAALRNLHQRPFVVLALARPEVHDLFPELWAERRLQEVRLNPLTRKASETLVSKVLGITVDAAAVARIVERSSGNAFYLEELIRAVAAGKGDALPETILAMVQARLEELEPEARRVLRAASLSGQVFWRDGVAALLGGADAQAQLGDWLQALTDREIIVKHSECKFPSTVEYAFRHGLMREAAYAALTEDDRKLGHRLVAEWLEQAGESHALVLAEHFERGLESGRAIGWYRRAAEQALEGNDLQAVFARAEKGVLLGASGETLGLLCLLQAEAHRWRGENAPAERAGLAAKTALDPQGPRFLQAAGEVALASGRLGNHDGLVHLAEELLELGPAAASGGAYAVALVRLAMHLLHAGKQDLAERLFERMGRVHPDVISRDPAARAWIDRARATRALFLGDLGAYLRSTEDAVASFDLAGDLRNVCQQRVNIGYANMTLGAWAEAEAALREALGAAERMGLFNVTTYAKHNLGLALARRGDLALAATIEGDATAAFVLQGDRRMEGASRIYLSLIAQLKGDAAAAEVEARTAVEVLVAAPPLRAYALAALADAVLAQGRAGDAAAFASEAMQLLSSLGGIDEGESLVRLVHARAEEAASGRPAGQASVRLARERLLERAARIRDATSRESFLARVPENSRTLELYREWVGDGGRATLA